MVFSQIGQEEFTVGVRKRGAVQGDCLAGAPRNHCGGYGVPPECQMERGSGTARAQANSYVLDKYMSTAFPLSIVLMELALHLQRAQVDLDLQWIPRDQNTEADALTNENFEGFEEAKRVPVKIEELEFLILHKLMKMAEEIDSEINLKRTSKEKSTHRDATKKMRLTQPW